MAEKDELIHEPENDDIQEAIRSHMEEEDKKNIAAPGETDEEKEIREKAEQEEKDKEGEGETEEEKKEREEKEAADKGKLEKDDKETKDKDDKDKESDSSETPSPSIEDFNKVLESEYESLDALKEMLDKAKDTDALRKSSEEWESKYNESKKLLEKYSNPLSHFKDENEYKRQQLLIKHPELNSQLAGEIFSKDIDKMDDLKAITLKTMLEVGA